MAMLSLRMRDDLKRKAQDLAPRQGVSLNNFINAGRRRDHTESTSSCPRNA